MIRAPKPLPIDTDQVDAAVSDAAIDADQLDAIHRKLDRLLAQAGPEQRWLAVKSAARYADLSPDSIRRLVERGDLVAYRPVPGKVLIDRQQLDRLILGSTTRPRNGRGRRRGKAAGGTIEQTRSRRGGRNQ